jgi:anti-sigma factor RsiW
MACDRYLNAIHELVDGTLGPLRRAELELHLESCDGCRALAGDLRELARAARSLEPIVPPPHVWAGIADTLRREGRAGRPTYTRAAAPVLALAAALILAVAASLYVVRPRGSAAPAEPAPPVAATAPAEGGNAAAADPVEGVDAELTKSVGHLQNAVEQATKMEDSLDPETAAVIQKNLLVINEAVAETRAVLKADPQNAAAQQTLYETLKQKIQFLQNTITLMNEMRQGDAAGAAEIVEGGKS